MCVVAMLVACRQHPFCKVADRASGRASDPERARSVTAEWDKVEIEWMGIVLRAGRTGEGAREGGLADVRPEGYVQNRPISARAFHTLHTHWPWISHKGRYIRAILKCSLLKWNNTFMWFGEFCSCCCLPLLPQLAWNILETTNYKP